jgi:phosphate transport system substrate-binding protein
VSEGKLPADAEVATRSPQPHRTVKLDGSGRSLVAAALISAAVIALAACSSTSPSGTPSPAGTSVQTTPASTAQALSETGSSLMAPLFALWGPAYHSSHSQVTVHTASSSSGVGISSAAAGAVDIGASDAYLSPSDVAEYSTLANIPLAVAALMVVYHVPGVSPSAHLRLDGAVLAQIFSGKITRWNDPAITSLNRGVALPDDPIVLIHRADTSGSTFLFTSYMNAQAPAAWSSFLIGTKVAWPQQPGETGATGSQGIISKLEATSGGLSYVGVSYKSDITGDSQLGMAALGNSSGNYELPTASAIDAGLASFTNTPANEAISLINGSEPQAYPIINFEYAIVDTAQASATLARDIQAFLYWTITSGTTQLAAVNFQPLPPPVATLSEAQIATIRG